ncbi:aminodeoxychorismate/anthranilate synthase component II [Bacillus sp. REN3]|uniref:anthranilate synthase component II n=1 Tax=Bacillus sp. REN3 TaxID=2802440 RepID=UPI001AEEEEA9|nr:aminodeoxychorismate/anthranilate synthase component II [Bacillus sp. REN3]
MILLIDNYDSFTFNLYQFLSELGADVKIFRNDKLALEEVGTLAPEGIVLSPGPGRPENAGICVDLIRTFSKTIPILGICLGHQAIGYAFGASIVRAKQILHGKQSTISCLPDSIFGSLPEKIEVMRYHSLVIDRKTLGPGFEILAETMDDREIMALKHKEYRLFGLQFHPESIGTKDGKQILKNFLDEIRKEKLAHETIS